MVTGPSNGVATAVFLSTQLVLLVWQGTRECFVATSTPAPVATSTSPAPTPAGFSTEAFWFVGALTFLAGVGLARVGSWFIRLGQAVGLTAAAGGAGFAAGALAAGSVSKEPEQDEESDVSGLIELYCGDGSGAGRSPAGAPQDW